ncbi:Abi family protein [Lacticaseibacillus porcinae]|uniref:Abi family protein n=1 Tax=Lacticaseibacillus porcinae TaxID=1123687 RepID=UPI0013DDD651|nr:Abi family protein [Lacticaseibacillus porcinae]
MTTWLEPMYLTPMQQYLKFAERGMHFKTTNRADDIKRISVIGYYKLKEYAYAMSAYDQYGNLFYQNTRFTNVVNKYYRDRRLKLALFNGIEEIEPYLVSTIVSVLGKRYGAFGYWHVKSWSDRAIQLSRVERFEQKFHRDVLRGTRYSTLDDLTIQSGLNLSPKGGFPTIWLLGDFITFGTAVTILQMMSIKNRRSVAKRFGCTADELVSWVRLLNFIRN